MKVTDNLTIWSEIPFYVVSGFRFLWSLNEHAYMEMEGTVKAGDMEKRLFQDYKGTAIRVEYEEDIVFCGMVTETRISAEGRLYKMSVKAASASLGLDKEPCQELFQDCSYTYCQMVSEMAERQSGRVIGTTGKERIADPQLCWGETVWEYARRMASYLGSSVIADVRTGRPAFWFGLRKGKRIEGHGLFCSRVEVRKMAGGHGGARTSYQLGGRENYDLGDEVWMDGAWRVIYEKRAELKKGETVFDYLAAREKELSPKVIYPKYQTGLSLPGTVEKAEGEKVYIRLDLDGKEGRYPFAWYPETGTALYAMPEAGAKAEVCFSGRYDGEVFAVRCRDSVGDECMEKQLKIPGDIKIIADSTMLKIESKKCMGLLDGNINFEGKQGIEISTSGKVKFYAKKIEINSVDEIQCITEI